MGQIIVRGLDDQMMDALEARAARRDRSLEAASSRNAKTEPRNATVNASIEDHA